MDGERREVGEERWRKGGVVGKGEREGREGRKEELRKAFLHGCC